RTITKGLFFLPISDLKIDGRLLRRLGESKVRAIIRGIQNTARELGLVTLAECVEDGTHAGILREIGVDWVQGHYYSEALLDNDALQRRQLRVDTAPACGHGRSAAPN
ncbi:MAG: EAL domain-containing protein, partial [Acidiferrobacterales bacterium]